MAQIVLLTEEWHNLVSRTHKESWEGKMIKVYLYEESVELRDELNRKIEESEVPEYGKPNEKKMRKLQKRKN